MPITKSEVQQENLLAGTALNGGRLLMMINGLAYYFDPTDENNFDRVIGFARNSVLIGEQVEIITAGPFSIGSLVTDDAYYAAPSGLITNVEPTSGIFLRVGVAKDGTVLEINFSEPIILA